MNEVAEYKPKKFWDRPEGTTGMITVGIAAVAAFFIGKAVLPSIIEFLDMSISAVGKGIVLTGLGAVLFAMIYILTNKQFQVAVSSIFKSSMRAITGQLVEIDPIGIMRNYIDTLKAKKVDMDRNISSLNGQITTIKEKVRKNSEGYDKAMATADVAKQRGMQMQFSLSARSAGRLEKSNVTYQQMLDKMTVLYRALKKYQEATAVTIADLTEEVQVKSDERATIIAASRASKGAMAILLGAGPEKELFDQAMEFTVADYGMRLGEIDDFMDTTRSILEGMDLQNGVYDAAAMEKLAAWESKADSLVLGDNKRLMLENMSVNSTTTWNNQPEKVLAGSGDDLDKFFKSR